MYKVAPHISWTPVEGELALFDGRDGSYHALNASAAEIWRGLAGGLAPDQVAARIAGAHGLTPDRIAPDVDAFAAEALAKGLLVA